MGQRLRWSQRVERRQEGVLRGLLVKEIEESTRELAGGLLEE